MGTDAKAVVRLSIDERLMLEKLLREPRIAKDRVLRIHMLLKSDANGPKWPDLKIAEAFEVSTDTVARLRQRGVFEGLEAATARRRPSVTRTRRLDGAVGRGGGSAAGVAGVFDSARWPCDVDDATARRRIRRIENRRRNQR